jgi:predicted NAD/FAD-binding protein
MGAAIWSCSVETILDFPAASFLRFFENHGLLTVNEQPQWYTVRGGSREYVARLAGPLGDRIRLNCGVERVRRLADQVEIADAFGRREAYDHVLFACHADEALALLETPTALEREILSAFRYQENRVVVHGDETFMPRTRGCWASWVYLSEGGTDAKPVVSLSYWMNQLQALNTKKPLLITLNPGREPKPELTYDRHSFSHPVFTLETLRAQKRLPEIQGKDRISWCGAYQRYGFHEDGLMSAVAAAAALGGSVL